MSDASPIVLWFRQDLRIHDNAAFAAALDSGRPILPVFIWDVEGEGGWPPGAASKVFLHRALESLASDLRRVGSNLILRQGASLPVLRDLLQEVGGSAVYWNRRYEPAVVKRDSEVKKQLREDGFEAESFNSTLLFEPWEVATAGGKPYQVYTPFWRNISNRPIPTPVEVDTQGLCLPATAPSSLDLSDFRLLPDHVWGEKIAAKWKPSEEFALSSLDEFISDSVSDYEARRNLPAIKGTSRLSPFLHWGLIGPRQVFEKATLSGQSQTKGGETFLKEIAWRDFAYHVLFHFPQTPTRPLREKFENFPWENNPEVLRKWRNGLTGYPIIDAGMRQLWEEGWMHNRVRMIVGSLLVKHLLHSWEEGARWFWDCLVDADLASNTLGWQWSGGCGADAAPYFRVFNPMTQGQKFDPEGEYVRKFVPELKNVPAKFIHQPWEADSSTLTEAGVELGKTYPYPVINHKEGRERALAAFERVKG